MDESLRANVYQRYQAQLTEDEFNAAEAYPDMDEVARHQGWLDPEMDAYDRLDPRRPS